MINSLTGLRFIAATIVVFVHAGNLAVGGGIGYGKWAANAVAFFFVLSGFILTYVYSERLERSTISTFYVARLARIWPLHLVCLGMAFGLQWYFNGFFWNAVAVRRFVSNVLLLHSWMPEPKSAFWFNGPYWSISTELAFYLAFPLLLFFLAKRPGGDVDFGLKLNSDRLVGFAGRRKCGAPNRQ